MIYGIGCDVLDLRRIERIIKNSKTEARFLNKVFTKKEIEFAPDNNKLLYNYYAKRFAAKEAFSKAVGTGIGRHVHFQDLEVMRKESGMPYFSKLPKLNFIYKAHLSLSDDRNIAMAYVVVELTNS